MCRYNGRNTPAPGAGVPGAEAGQAYIIFGRPNSSTWPASLDLSSLDGINGVALNGMDSGDRTGQSVSSGGDVNGDGVHDLVIGTPQSNPSIPTIAPTPATTITVTTTDGLTALTSTPQPTIAPTPEPTIAPTPEPTPPEDSDSGSGSDSDSDSGSESSDSGSESGGGSESDNGSEGGSGSGTSWRWGRHNLFSRSGSGRNLRTPHHL